MDNWSSTTVIEFKYKGFPIDSYGKTLEQFLATKPNLFTSNFQFPIMVLKESALNNNIAQMMSFCNSVKAELAPHVKTTMSPQLAKMQIAAGASALTVANFWQASIFLKFGFKNLIIANEVLDPMAIAAIAKINKLKQAEIIFYVDSIAGLETIQKHTPIEDEQNLFIEIGTENGRGGVRDLAQVEQIAQQIRADSRLKLRGVTGFEGAVPDGARGRRGEKKLVKFCQKIVAAANLAYPNKSEEVFTISAGGSAYFDIVARELNKFDKQRRLLLRSGGYITHDHRYYEEIYPFAATDRSFQPAIEVWAQVISKPEQDFGVLNLGKRDIGNDLHNPIPIKSYDGQVKSFSAVIEKLNDQHGYLRTRADFQLAQLIGLGISHPCTTFDKWRLVPLVNDNYDVVDCLQTFF
jgi:D-serine deaminase-like pyridoxal phosphate-dependent protein